MPNMDGYSLCSEVCRHIEFDEIPFILYTSTDFTPADEKLGLELGADRFMKKLGSSNVILTQSRKSPERASRVAASIPGPQTNFQRRR
jgi:DNA-binding response OmpR family regulator